jgi:hypothetical protein
LKINLKAVNPTLKGDVMKVKTNVKAGGKPKGLAMN